MKGITKAVMRTPHQLTSRIGMAKKTTDLEFDDSNRKFTAIEGATERLLRDSSAFRDSVSTLLISGSSFGTSLTNIFSPMGSEYDLSSKFPNAEVTLRNIGSYQHLMQELNETLAPELELIESRVITPMTEVQDICKRIRKTIVKRDHKLLDFDRHNNSLNKLREKKEKSLSDEKNLFKVEQDFELANQDYEHYNNLLKQELPIFLLMAAKFATPIFHSFYYMQLNVFYLMQDKLQGYADGKYDTTQDIESTYMAQRGETADELEELTITKRMVSTAKLMANRRTASTSGSPLKAGLGRTNSYASDTKRDSSSLASKYGAPGPSPTTAAVAVPPPYSPSGSAVSSAVGRSSSIKKAPPPPPPMKRGASLLVKPPTCTALFDFTAQAEGDLTFRAGDIIEIVERSESADDWWTGRLPGGPSGVFPGSYTQLND